MAWLGLVGCGKDAPKSVSEYIEADQGGKSQANNLCYYLLYETYYRSWSSDASDTTPPACVYSGGVYCWTTPVGDNGDCGPAEYRAAVNKVQANTKAKKVMDSCADEAVAEFAKSAQYCRDTGDAA